MSYIPVVFEGKDFLKGGFKTRVENAMKKVNKRSRIRAWRWRRAGWWCTRLIRNMNRKLVPQVRCSMLEGAVCDLEARVNELMVREEWPMWMTEWIEKAGLWWDHAGNVKKKTEWAYVIRSIGVEASSTGETFCLTGGTVATLVY